MLSVNALMEEIYSRKEPIREGSAGQDFFSDNIQGQSGHSGGEWFRKVNLGQDPAEII